MRQRLWPAPDSQTPARDTPNCDNPRASKPGRTKSEMCARNMRRATLGADTAHAQAGQTHNETQQRRRRSKCNTPLRPYTNRKPSAF